jgi:hypothetical protein
MATFGSIGAVGKSIERLVQAGFEATPPVAGIVQVKLVRSDDFATGTAASSITFPALSIFLYRIEINRTMRAAWSAVGSLDGRARLPVDLHYLLTAWAKDPQHEHEILGRALQCLEETPILSGPLLFPSADWAPGEAVQIVAEDVPTDTVLRTFEGLVADFRLSLPYVARVIRIDGLASSPSPAVTTAVAGTNPVDP